MAMDVKELKRWLATLPDDWHVAIDDGGLTFDAVEDPSVWIEIGGHPRPDDDDDQEADHERSL